MKNKRTIDPLVIRRSKRLKTYNKCHSFNTGCTECYYDEYHCIHCPKYTNNYFIPPIDIFNFSSNNLSTEIKTNDKHHVDVYPEVIHDNDNKSGEGVEIVNNIHDDIHHDDVYRFSSKNRPDGISKGIDGNEDGDGVVQKGKGEIIDDNISERFFEEKRNDLSFHSEGIEGEVVHKEEREEKVIYNDHQLSDEINTDDEIEIIYNKDDTLIIKNNIKNLIDFLDSTLETSISAIKETFYKLDLADNCDYEFSLFEKLLLKAYESISTSNIKGCNYIAWVLSGIINSYNKETPHELLNQLDGLTDRFKQTIFQMKVSLSRIYDDPQRYININYDIPFGNKKKINIKELIEVEIPNKYNSYYPDLLNAYFNGVRYFITKHEMSTNLDFSIVAVSSIGKKCSPNSEDDILWMWNSKSSYSQTIDNTELGINADRRISYATGKNFYDTAGEFCETSCNGFVIKVNDKIYYRKYYIMNSDDEIYNDHFYRWLIQDDGFGNISRPNSVACREDIFRNWGLTGSDKIKII
jgi:hypothetical protein